MPPRRVTEAEVDRAETLGIRRLSLSEMMKLELYSGRETDFESWTYKAAGIWSQLGWTDHIEAAEVNVGFDGVRRVDLGEIASVFGSGFSAFLRKTMCGEASGLLKQYDAESSFVQWKVICQRCRPAGAEPSAAMLRAILHPLWWRQHEHNRRPFYQVVVDWENLILRYQASTTERISEPTRCATVLALGPKHVVDMLNTKPEIDRVDWLQMRSRIQEMSSAGQKVSEYYIPAPPTPYGTQP